MKTYKITVEVDTDALIAAYSDAEGAAYRDGDHSLQLYDLPPITEIIESEMGWVSSSGIYVKEVKEVQQ